jgi:two-component system phosphate regulon response regulator PhoB
VKIDKASFEVRVDDKELELTRTEFRLLWTLMRQPGRTFSRLELMDSSRGMDANALERTIDVHVRALRKKMGQPGNLIETIRGIGYRFKRE